MRAAARYSVAALILGSGCSSAPADPVELRLANPVGATAFHASYRQDIDWGEAKVSREYGARYSLRVDASDPDRSLATLDSLSVVVSTPHGRQSLDTRGLVGEAFTVAVAPRGGPATYGDEPVFEMPGMLEQRVALGRLADYGFPPLPPGPVRRGDVWTARHARPHAEGQILVTAEIETDVEHVGWETVDGVACIRLVGRVRGTASGSAAQEHGPAVAYDGEISGTIEWLLDPVTGVVVRTRGEEVSEGILAAGPAETRMRQVTRVEITATQETR